MSNPKKYTEKTEVETEVKVDTDALEDRKYRKETTVKTERTVEKEEEEDKPVIVIQNE